MFTPIAIFLLLCVGSVLIVQFYVCLRGLRAEKFEVPWEFLYHPTGL